MSYVLSVVAAVPLPDTISRYHFRNIFMFAVCKLSMYMTIQNPETFKWKTKTSIVIIHSETLRSYRLTNLKNGTPHR